MAYASNADVLQRMGSTLYVQLTDDASAGAADEGKVTDARLAAEAEVDSYLGRRYAVPVNVTGQGEVQAILRSTTLDLVEYRLHARRPPVPMDVNAKRAAAVWWLERAAEGTVVLPASVALAVSEQEGSRGQSVGAARVWTREQARGL